VIRWKKRYRKKRTREYDRQSEWDLLTVAEVEYELPSFEWEDMPEQRAIESTDERFS
jgi:hypothetical protein